ncbi:MAG: hypothetical protein GWP08_10565 [Nitrospiraceae bacterium]|nr:hypothetical protein [Nitrospiraceae bacterium]
MENILDECVEEMRAGQNIEDVLEKHTQFAEELRPLLAIASRLESLPAPSPSMAGMTRSMTRFSSDAVARSRRKHRGWPALLYQPALARAAAILVVAAALLWGTTTVSAGALPGDLLYPIKLATERAKFYLTINPEEKAELRIVFSEERLKEVVKAYNRGDGVKEELLETMLEEARKAVEIGAGLTGESGDLLVVRAANLSDYQREVLKRLGDNAPPPDREVFTSWMDMCGQRGGWMRGWVDDAQDAPRDETPTERRNRRMMRCPM